MTSLDRAREVLSHYLTQGGSWGEKAEVENALDHLLEAAVEMVEARLIARSVVASPRPPVAASPSGSPSPAPSKTE